MRWLVYLLAAVGAFDLFILSLGLIAAWHAGRRERKHFRSHWRIIDHGGIDGLPGEFHPPYFGPVPTGDEVGDFAAMLQALRVDIQP